MRPEPSSRHPAPALVRVVADPNVLVSAAVTPSGVCAQLLSKLLESSLEIVASPLLLDEVERVLRRPRFDLLAPALRMSYVEYLHRIARIEEDPPASGSPLVATDPGDDYLIALAAANAALLVSGDEHLLTLADRVPVCSPAAFLARLAADS